MVDIFDELDGLEARVPLLGSVSAMDIVRESFVGVSEAEDLIRSLDRELNALDDNAAALTRASGRILGVELSSVSGDEMEILFRDTSEAARDMESSMASAEGYVSEAREAVGDLAGALRAGSDTPLIGSALGDFGRSASQFEAELSGLSSLLGGFETELDALGSDLESALDSAGETLQADMERWLPEPYDAQWPPTDSEGQTMEATPQPTAEPGQTSEPATAAPPGDDGSETGGKPADYQRVYQAAYDEAYQKRYNEVFDDNRDRFGGR